MKKLILILTVLLSSSVYADKCDELKDETIYYFSTSITSEKTNELLKNLSSCSFDKYDVALISDPVFFMQLMNNLIASKNDNIKVGDIVNSFTIFKTNNSEIYQDKHSQIKQFVDYYSTKVTRGNLDSYISQWGELNGQEISIELKLYIVTNKLANNQNSYKNVLNNFYKLNYGLLVFNDNLNSISWKSTNPSELSSEIEKSFYQDRINITSNKTDSQITLTIELLNDWSIYSIEKESNNVFRSIVESENECFEILNGINVLGETTTKDPMGIHDDVKLISGISKVIIPYREKCNGPLKLAFTFTLIKNDGSSLPFIKEIIQIK